MRGRTRVTGLLARPGDPPRVLGVRTDTGELAADLVVDAAGRLSRTLRGAVDLVETLDKHADDPRAQALAMDVAVGEHIAPFYADQAAIDADRLAAQRHAVLGAPPPAPSAVLADQVTYAELRSAAPWDPDAFRAYSRVMGALALPDDVYRDQALVARVREVIAERGSAPPMAQPSTEQLLTALATGW